MNDNALRSQNASVTEPQRELDYTYKTSTTKKPSLVREGGPRSGG